MKKFVCRVCGHNICRRVYDMYMCEGCSVLFLDESMFSLPIVKYKKLHPDAIPPTKAKPLDVGYDVFALNDYILPPLTTVMLETGLSVELPPNTEIQVRPRSGLALKESIMVVNSPGTIDTGYRGPCNVLLMKVANTETQYYSIKKGDKIAQFLVTTKLPYVFEEELGELSSTDRGVKGFGSTGN